MELFYSRDIEGGICRLDADESGHCVRVLRHRSGDEISVIDGCGALYRCRITCDSHKGVEAAVLSAEEGWGSHPYRLHLAVCPTKNNDRFEWFAEKACEIGFDRLSPVIGDHSERRVLKTARVEKILVSAAKQSLKAAVPTVDEPVSVKEFIKMHGMPDQAGDDDHEGGHEIPDQVGDDDHEAWDDVPLPKNPPPKTLLLLLREGAEVLVILPPGPAVVDDFVDGSPVGKAAYGAVVDEEVGVELAGTDAGFVDFFAGVVAVDGEEFNSAFAAEVYGFLEELAFAGSPEDEPVSVFLKFS